MNIDFKSAHINDLLCHSNNHRDFFDDWYITKTMYSRMDQVKFFKGCLP